MKFLYKYTFIILSLGFFLISCEDNNDPEDVFQESSTERLNAQEAEVSNLLQSSEYGWKMTYFTDDPRYTETDQQLGGWTFIFNFTDNSHVTMVSDFSTETLEPEESEYDIKLGSTTKLSFTTKNHIHNLSDANNSPISSLTGKGYKGDFEFLYYGQEGEDLIFRSNRFQVEVRFEPATEEDWENISENIETENLLRSSGELQLETSEGGEVNVYDLAFSPATRFATNLDDSDLSFGLAMKPDGVIAVDPIEVGESEAMNFTYDSTNNWFISELENGNYAKIILGDPILISDVLDNYYFSALRISGHPLLDSSDDFFTVLLDGEEVLIQETSVEVLYGFFIVPGQLIQYVFIDDNDDVIDPRPNRLMSSYSVDDSTGILTLQDDQWETPSHSIYDNGLQGVHDILFDPQGLKVIPTGSLYNGNPVFRLESVSNPSMTITVGTIEY